MLEFIFKRRPAEALPDFAPLIRKNPEAPPPWSNNLKKYYSSGTSVVISDANATRIWESRPLLDAEEFAKYWASADEAEIAWKILHLAESNFIRPTLPMAYPNDPMGLYCAWRGDSLDDVEYIMTLDEMFSISIPDADAEKIFCTFTLLETVRYLHAKQKREL